MKKYSSRIDMERHRSDSLIVRCSDPRFQNVYREAVDHFDEYYDLMALPGASKAIVSEPAAIKEAKRLHSLHHFGIIRILDHVTCAAFGEVDDEAEAHRRMITEARSQLKKVLPGVEVQGYLFDKDGFYPLN